MQRYLIIVRRYEMSGTVGSRGQIVIEKAIRDRMGIVPGVHTIQKIVADHVEIFFLPTKKNGSLKGALAPYIKVKFSHEDKLQAAMEDIWVSEG